MLLKLNLKMQRKKHKRGNKLILVTNLFGRTILFQCFSLCCCTILVGTAYVNNIVIPKTTVPSKHIGTQHTCSKSNQQSWTSKLRTREMYKIFQSITWTNKFNVQMWILEEKNESMIKRTYIQLCYRDEGRYWRKAKH